MTVFVLLIATLLLPANLLARPIELSLGEALALADRHDTGLESARIEVELGDALVREATSGALPLLNLNASTGRFVIAPTSSIPAFGPGKFRFTPVNDLSIGLSISQPVWLGGRLGLALEAANIYGRLSRAAMQAAKANLKKQIIQDYFRLSLAFEVLKITNAAYAQALSHALKAKQMFDVGMISEFDLLRAETEAKTMAPEVSRSLQAIRLAHTNLCHRLGLPGDTELLLLDSLTAIEISEPAANATDYYEIALARRPEIELIGLQKSLHEIGLKVEEKSLFWPNVFFGLGFQTQRQDDHYANMSPSTWSNSLRWGFSANIPLFNGFATQAKIQKARLGLRKTELAEKNLQNGIRMEFVANTSELQRAFKSVIGQQEVVKLAEKAYAISQVRYEQGLGTELEVQDVRLTLSRARMGYLQGLYDLRLAEAEYARIIEIDAELTSGSSK